MPESKELNYSLWVPREECKEEAQLHLFACAVVQSMHLCPRIQKHSHPSQSIVVLGRKSFQGIECVGACGGLDLHRLTV